jgi:hypothetical protein
MADLSNIIYTAVLSNPHQPEGVTEPWAQRPCLPRQAGAAARLAPLLAILTLSLILLSLSVFGSHGPATDRSSPVRVYSNARHSAACHSADASCRVAALTYAPCRSATHASPFRQKATVWPSPSSRQSATLSSYVAAALVLAP